MRNNEDRIGTKFNKSEDFVENNKDLNFIVPTEFVSLPSEGKFYPELHPLHGCDVVEIKQMTAKEEDILTSKSLLKKGVALDRLMESLIVNKEIDIDSLTIEDRNAIVVNARISGYGEIYDTNVSCPACSKRVKYSFNILENIEKDSSDEIERLEFLEQTVVDENGHFTIYLPNTKWTVVCRALNGYDEKSILNLSEAKKRKSNDSFLLDQLKMMIVSIQGVQDKNMIEEAIEMLPAKDSKYLRKAYSLMVKPFEIKQQFVCPECEHQADMEVPLSADFFWFK